MVLFFLVLICLWIISIVSFARWRLYILEKKEKIVFINNDWILQIYIKVSGLAVFISLIMKLSSE